MLSMNEFRNKQKISMSIGPQLNNKILFPSLNDLENSTSDCLDANSSTLNNSLLALSFPKVTKREESQTFLRILNR